MPTRPRCGPNKQMVPSAPLTGSLSRPRFNESRKLIGRRLFKRTRSASIKRVCIIRPGWYSTGPTVKRSPNKGDSRFRYTPASRGRDIHFVWEVSHDQTVGGGRFPVFVVGRLGGG